MAPKTLLITDLDNTLWDWFEAWYESFPALLDGLFQTSDLPVAQLEREIRAVHQARRITEYFSCSERSHLSSRQRTV